MPSLRKPLRSAESESACPQRLLTISLVIAILLLFSISTDGQNTLAPWAGEHPNTWKIAFDRTAIRSSSGFLAILTDVYVMNSDGSHEQKLTNSGLCHRPNWSPDGSQLLFLCLDDNSESHTLPGSNEPDQEIGVTDSSAQNPRILKPGVKIYDGPSWLPNGKTIAFGNVRFATASRKMGVTDHSVYTMPVDAAEPPHSILKGASQANWSPDGQKLAYVAYRNSKGNSAIYVANADGSEGHPLTDPKIRAYSLSWSPDSRKIAFVRWRGNRHAIGIIDVQGGQFEELAPHNLDAFELEWSHDGKRIAFSARRSESMQVFLINADRTGLRRLSNEKEKDCVHPSWSPDGSQIVFECQTRILFSPLFTDLSSILFGSIGSMRPVPPVAQIYLANVNAPDALPIQLTHTGGSNPRFYPVMPSSRVSAAN